VDGLNPLKATIEEEVDIEGKKFVERLELKQMDPSNGNRNFKKKKGRYNYDMDDIDER